MGIRKLLGASVVSRRPRVELRRRGGIRGAEEHNKAVLAQARMAKPPACRSRKSNRGGEVGVEELVKSEEVIGMVQLWQVFLRVSGELEGNRYLPNVLVLDLHGANLGVEENNQKEQEVENKYFVMIDLGKL